MLNANIKVALYLNPLSAKYLNHQNHTTNLNWDIDPNGLLYWKGHIIVPNTGGLQLWILKAKYDHLLADH